ncbi:unnamed protein product [Cylindrotheca closterium]|uniref:Uncharacterized protein n=1 Tax=Cylindrotheca closterium TaxID=2856 RepID=A0AAD2FP72_9STRA|nr:unnamed protein product [Cylindrotheca closterium]
MTPSRTRKDFAFLQLAAYHKIADHSFWGLNEKTMKLALEGAMQFGTAPLRIREALMKANPDYGPVYTYKNDMSGGFYRIQLSTTGALKLGVILPRFEGLPQLVALPLVLPMGWTERPPWFCAFTETVADLTNVDLQQNKRVPPHPLRRAAAITDFEMEVFVDNFVGMDQDHPSNPLTNQQAVLSHNTDKVFQQNQPTDNKWRKEPQSQSKMAKGDALWHTVKEALGWNWGCDNQDRVTPRRGPGLQTSLPETMAADVRRLTKPAARNVGQ